MTSFMGKIPDGWVKSEIVVLIYKQIGDVMESGSYRGVKLMERAMKIPESVVD